MLLSFSSNTSSAFLHLSWGDSFFSFFAETTDLEGGIEVDLVDSFYLKSVINTDSDAVTKTLITVSRGPRMFKYKPVTLFLQSSCENDMGRFPGRKKRGPVDKVQLYNNGGIPSDGSAAIEFLQPCPAIEIAGDLKTKNSFLINTKSPTISTTDSRQYMDVVVFNIQYERLGKMSNMKRMQQIVFEYRQVGTIEWFTGKNATNHDINFADEEDTYGYSQVRWPIPQTDADYEIRVRVDCINSEDPAGLPSEMLEFATASVQGLIDRTPPKMYGIPRFELPAEVHPSNEFVLPFTEELYCATPFVFTLNLNITKDGTTEMLSNDNGIYVTCEGREIKYRFD